MNSHYDYATTLQIQTNATETLAMLSGYIQRLQIADSSWNEDLSACCMNITRKLV